MRPLPDSNRGWRICNPLPYRLAKGPSWADGILADLFGRVNEAHVFLDADEESGWYIEETIDGSTISEVLTMTQWDKNELIRQVKVQVDAAIKSDRLKPNEAMRLLASYERGLKGYTYLQFNGHTGKST